MLFTKCILHKALPEDGIRISVMSRHTLNDGQTPDPRIQKYHFHIPALGPSPRLIGRYYRTNMCLLDFSNAYRCEMQAPSKQRLIKIIAWLSLFTDITLLCVEDNSDCCHRSLLTRLCKQYVPEVEIEHR